MRYGEFGKTGMKLSKMCLGTWGIGGAGWDYNPEEAKIQAIRAAYEEGVNFFDTAPIYNFGVAEQILGKAVKEMGVRKDICIASKCGNEIVDGVYIHSSKREDIRRHCEGSLRNLQTDYIDIYLIHWPDPTTPMEEAMDTMKELQKEGKIRFIGLSNFSKEQIDECSKYAEISACQMQYSMLVREFADVLSYAHENNIGTMAYGPLGGGILTGRYRELKEYEPKDNRNRFYQYFKEPGFSKAMKLLGTLDGISEARGGMPLSQIVLSWTANQPFISGVLTGAQREERVRQNTAGFDLVLTDEETAAIDRAIAELDL